MDKLLAESTRVLIIDDQVLAQGYMKYSLQELGFKDISYVDSAISGLKAISTKRYDLIVCSYNLKQDHDGLYLYNELKNKSLLPYSTAFVFISADTSTEIVHSVVDIQPDDFLAKPYTLRELDKRLGRVLKRKSAMRKAYQLMDKKEYKEALSETENILTSPDMSEFFPAALKLKGELLLATEQPDKAKDFYNAILNVQTFSWATIGLIKSLIALNDDEEAEKLILRLAFKPESQLLAYDLLSSLHIKKEDFDTALESVVLASEISPRNINRHQQAVELSRITHDYQTQFEVAKTIVKITKDSIHDKPENYLIAARAGIDYAMAAEEHESKKIINQASDFVTQTSKNLPRNEMQSQMTIINARLHLLKDDKTKAKELIETLSEDNYDSYSLEDLLDKAKAYHDLGLHDQSLDLMGEIEARCHKDDSQGALFMHYVKKEKAEKADIKLPPRALNNQAVERYERGDIDAALQSFKQALTIMPKSAAIALNLLQTLVLKSKDKGVHKENEDIVNRCIKTISDGRLNPEQHERYQKVKSLLTQMN